MNIELQLGEPVEVISREKFVGYVFKLDEKRLVLCSSERFDENNLVAIPTDNVIEISRFRDPKSSAIIDAKNQPVEVIPEEKKGKLLKFPGPKEIS